MAQRSKQKISSWVTPAFDDVEFATPLPDKKRKRPRQQTATPFDKKSFKGGSSSLWVELYAPTRKDDLAVHKKKVQEVEGWLVESMAGMKGRRFLLLSGPSGCGKSATVRILAKEAGLNLVEWINPLSSSSYDSFQDEENVWIPGDRVASVSQTDLFKEFFIRSSKYASVCEASHKGNLILVEDFPNVFLRDPTIFHNLLRHYQQRGTSPVVFIVTNSVTQQNSVKHLFPPHIQEDLSIINIEFNAIANGILMKALNRILGMKNICEGSGGQPIPPREALESLIESSGGDIRSAVNALQFAIKKDVYQLQELFSSSTKAKKGSAKSKSRSKFTGSKKTPSKLSDNEEESLAVVGGKDASLFLFRALGKILYCKRDQEKGVVDHLPKHLNKQERLPLLENAEDVFDKTSMGASSLSTFLHQNMLPFYSDIEGAAQALQHLTDSDILAGEWLGRIALEKYSASVTIRGLMHANKTCTSGGGWRAFNKPMWFNVHKQSQQNLLALKSENPLLSVTSEELATVIVPLQAKLLAAQGKGHFTKSREVGLFSLHNMKNSADKLSENDVDANLTEEESFLGVIAKSDSTTDTESKEELPTNTETCGEDPEEDFRIDEFPDD